ncbi:15614_t:CDS:1, partial [Acaulospora morrowiae]
MGAPAKETSTENTTSESSTTKNSANTEAGLAKSKRYRIALGDVTPNNLGQLKRLNSVLFPVNYSERFYKDV